MENLIIAFDGIGEASLYIVDDKTYDILFAIYESQEATGDGYSKMMGDFWRRFEKIENSNGIDFQRLTLQWNSDDILESPVTFKRILQLLME
jgi:hypothetical protein